MTNQEPLEPDKTDKPTDPALLPVVDAEELLQGCREVYIEYRGERYRLRLTRRNKLILQK